MPYLTYIIQSSKTRKYYTGHTSDLSKRIEQHNLNKTKSLINKGPFSIIYTETYLTKKEAYRREMEIKRYKGGIQFKNLIKST